MTITITEAKREAAIIAIGALRHHGLEPDKDQYPDEHDRALINHEITLIYSKLERQAFAGKE